MTKTLIGVEIDGIEYAYGGNSLVDCSGIYDMFPKKHDVFMYKFSMEAGECESDY